MQVKISDVMVSISYPETKDQWARDDPAFEQLGPEGKERPLAV